MRTLRDLSLLLMITLLLFCSLAAAQTSYPPARYGHSTVWIGEKMYVFGGMQPISKTGVKSSNEPGNDLWEFGESGGWSELADIDAPEARSEHVAVEYNGAMYVQGGKGSDWDNYLRDIVKYIPETGTWTALAAGGAVPNNVAEHAALAWNGKIWIYGGHNRFRSEDQQQHDELNNYLFSYDPSTNLWNYETTFGDAPKLKGHSMVVKDDKFYVFGGRNDNNVRQDKLLELDLNTRTWSDKTPAGDKPTARAYHRAVILGDKMRILGGYTDEGTSSQVWEYDFGNGTFSQKTDMPVALQRSGVSAKETGVQKSVYVLQGQEGYETKEESYKCEIQEGEDDRWERYEKTEQRWISTDGIPTLTLSRQLVAHEPICLDCNGEPVTVFFITIAANAIDSWIVYTVQFRAGGSGDDLNHIENVGLYMGSQLLSTGEYNSDDALLTLSVNKVLQPGENITLKLVYNFQPDLEHNYEVWTYAASTSVARVNAEPENYTRYEKLPPQVQSSTEIILAPVINISTQEGFGSIQGAIEDDDTEDYHSISVCPGLYEENIVVHKSLTISSRDGREVTIVAGDVNGHVFRVQSDDTEISGFTIRGKGQNDPWHAAGISCDSLVQSCRITRNLITNHYHAGISLWSNSNCSITGNLIRENISAGIRLYNACMNNRIGGTSATERNVISKNGESGIEMASYSGSKSVSSGTVILGNYIGTDVSGTSTDGNGYDGINARMSEKTRVGGKTSAERNIISGNGRHGIFGADTVQGNYIGTDVTGMLDLGNSGDGVSECLVVGGPEVSARNIISGNGQNGVYDRDKGSDVNGNFIGVDVTGLNALPNDGTGIISTNVSHSAKRIQNNVISRNKKCGIEIGAESCTVAGNYIGTDSTGCAPLPNHRFGIWINEGASKCIIGGTIPQSRNIISGNESHGIAVTSGEGGGYENVICGNYIGLSATGVKMGNDSCGIYIASGHITIGGTEEGTRNVISGNGSHGIDVGSLTRDVICGNYIGTNVQGSSAIGNAKSGICLNYVEKITIGCDKNGEGRGNVISGNAENGIYAEYSIPWIRGNFIGTDYRGQSAVANGKSGIYLYGGDRRGIEIGGTAAGTRNIISGNTENGIVLYGTTSARVEGNRIGTDLSGTSALGNGSNGVYLYCACTTRIGNKSTAGRNTISGNGQNGIWIDESADIYPNQICGNFIGTDVTGSLHSIPNALSGIYCTNSQEAVISNNRIWYNCWGIKERNSRNTITANSIRYNSCSTGVRLDNSHSVLVGNEISDDVGSGGIACQNGAQPIIMKNNIHDNNGYALSNEDPAVVLNASDNWWGNPAGPGDGVQGNVACDSWLAGPSTVIVKASREELFLLPGEADTVWLTFCNWQDSLDVLNVEVEADSADWLRSARNFSISLGDSNAADLCIAVPADAAPGSASSVKIRAASQSDPTHFDSDSLYIRSYSAALEYLVVSPDSARLRSGGLQQYEAAGYDSAGNRVEIAIDWSSDGGDIDDNGLFKAGRESGWFSVQAVDPATAVTDSAIVEILPYLHRIEVQPDSLILSPDAGQQYSAAGYDSLNNAVEIFPVWQVSAGSIDQNGYFSAGPDSGMSLITVRDSLSDVIGGAIVFIMPGTAVEHEFTRPLEFSLEQNYPNPFNPSTTIRYSVKEACQVSLKLYDIRSRELFTIVEKYQQSGEYGIHFTALQLASGVYFYRIQMGEFTAVRKMLLMK